MSKETLILNRFVWSFNATQDSKLRAEGKPARIDRSEEIKDIKPGDTLSIDAASPGTGKWTYTITKVDNEGVWGFLISDTVRELSLRDVI